MPLGEANIFDARRPSMWVDTPSSLDDSTSGHIDRWMYDFPARNAGCLITMNTGVGPSGGGGSGHLEIIMSRGHTLTRQL